MTKPLMEFVKERRASAYLSTRVPKWLGDHPEVAQQILEANESGGVGIISIIDWLDEEYPGHPVTRHTLINWVKRRR